MFINRFFKVLVISWAILFAASGVVFAVNDGFAAANKIKSGHFTVFYESGVDVPGLTAQLNIGASERILVGKPAEEKTSSDEELAETLDTLYLRVCDILDMRPYRSFEGNIKICRDHAQLKKIYYNLFGRDLNNMQSFYVHELKTVYTYAGGFRAGIIGHEIAHAVMNHYFVVSPSVTVQEILAGYVEYQLRKSDQP